MIVFSIIVIAVVLFMAFVFGYMGYWLIRNFIAPTKRTRAIVIRKRHNHWDASIPLETGRLRGGMLGSYSVEADRARSTRNLPEISLAEGTDCYITFGFDGREVEFAVPSRLYIDTDDGDEGLLVYKGEKFKFFIPHVQ